MNIALDDIRSKAPEGATHYDDEGNYYKYNEYSLVWFVYKVSGYNDGVKYWCSAFQWTDDIKPLN